MHWTRSYFFFSSRLSVEAGFLEYASTMLPLSDLPFPERLSAFLPSLSLALVRISERTLDRGSLFLQAIRKHDGTTGRMDREREEKNSLSPRSCAFYPILPVAFHACDKDPFLAEKND